MYVQQKPETPLFVSGDVPSSVNITHLLLSAIVRCVVALHNLLDNKLNLKEQAEERERKDKEVKELESKNDKQET